MSKPITISEADKEKYTNELIGEITKNIVVYELYESFYQAKESNKDITQDELTRLGNIQRELKNNRQIFEHLQLTKKVK